MISLKRERENFNLIISRLSIREYHFYRYIQSNSRYIHTTNHTLSYCGSYGMVHTVGVSGASGVGSPGWSFINMSGPSEVEEDSTRQIFGELDIKRIELLEQSQIQKWIKKKTFRKNSMKFKQSYSQLLVESLAISRFLLRGASGASGEQPLGSTGWFMVVQALVVFWLLHSSV